MQQLAELADYNGGARQTQGLDGTELLSFLDRDERLGHAVDRAYQRHQALRTEFDAELRLPEADLVTHLQQGILNFYGATAINPYVPLAASGPWVVTSCGAVLLETGGYGMLGHGFNPAIFSGLVADHVQANIMTASFEQHRFVQQLFSEIGHTRKEQNGKLYARVAFLNSGSEAMSFAAKLADINAKQRKGTLKPVRLALQGSFHGRTHVPARVSDSDSDAYEGHLASFADHSDLITIEPNNINELRRVFAESKANGQFIEAFYLEPVMGEGNPGLAISPKFYQVARELTRKSGALLIVDSVQAGLRTHGVLSLVDYPDFQGLEPPDIEAFSKALNAGGYPLSAVVLREEVAALYPPGLHGNTMTGNPRALDFAMRVLESLTPELRANIVARGQQFLDGFKALQKEFADKCDKGWITKVQGTGLLLSVSLNPKVFQVVGQNGVEQYMRRHGMGVIHGGKDGATLRFTPTFDITPELVEEVVAQVRHALLNGPRLTP